MQLFFKLCNILALSTAVSSEEKTLQKVLQMMNDMLANSKKAKSKEHATFLEYKHFCQSTCAEKSRAVMDGEFQIAQLNGMISKATEDVNSLASEIALLTNDIDELSGQTAMNQEYRKKEHADFTAGHGTYISAIDAVDRALPTNSSNQTCAQVTDSLVALNSLNLPSSARKAVTVATRIQRLKGRHSNQNPTEVDLKRVVAMVEGIGKQFKDEKYELEKEEAQQKHASNMVEQDLQASISRSTKEQSDKIATKAQLEKVKAESEGRLLNTTASVAADTQDLAKLIQGCSVKALENDENQSEYATEIKALMQAIDTISGGAVASSLKHLPTLMTASFPKVHFRSAGQSPKQKHVATFLSDHARKMNSQILSFVAVRVAADPFQKAKKMIQDMVLELMEEHLDEAEPKGFCETEIIRDATTEELDASTANFESEAADLNHEISDLDNAMALATKARAEEKVHNAAILADAVAASAATAQALQLLKENDGNIAATVVGMLEAMKSDFIRLETETQAAEDRAEEDFSDFKRNSSQVKAVKSTEISYLKQLKPSCVDAGESYKEHVMRRKEEIALLTDALKTL